jgi:uncharacterized protein (TIGR03437 family)
MPLHNTLWKTVLAATLCSAAFSQSGLGQVPPPTILQIDTANNVLYIEDISDPAKFATDPNVTTPGHPNNFFRNAFIGDIRAVNGKSVMGTFTGTGPGGAYVRTAPTLGMAIADTVRNGVQVISFEILKSDGTPIGTIMGSGFTAGASPPGSPSNVSGNNFVITGGTGAFLGARGQAGTAANPPGVAPQRGASITEDPANRRQNGGGSQQWVIHLIPMESPEIVKAAGGPAISHSSDLSLVTAARPAAVGETLSIFARGLGPVNPGVDPGAPFPSAPLAIVNSPVEVTVNGKAAEVLSAVGYPGAVDAYQVNFRVPPDTGTGLASIQISAAWISGPTVTIPVQ